jgi:hypothetical protein
MSTMEQAIREAMGGRRDRSAGGDALARGLAPPPPVHRPAWRPPLRLDGRLERLLALAAADPGRHARVAGADRAAAGGSAAAKAAPGAGGR